MLSVPQVGDKVAFASTDYDHRQAEEATITAIDGNRISVKGKFGPIKFMHYGESYEGKYVDIVRLLCIFAKIWIKYR